MKRQDLLNLLILCDVNADHIDLLTRCYSIKQKNKHIYLTGTVTQTNSEQWIEDEADKIADYIEEHNIDHRNVTVTVKSNPHATCHTDTHQCTITHKYRFKSDEIYKLAATIKFCTDRCTDIFNLPKTYSQFLIEESPLED